MSEPASDPRLLDAAQARRMLGTLALRPNERVLCLGPDGGAVPGVATILVGPTGRIVEADPAAVTAGAPLPYPDSEFDAVILDLTEPYPDHARLLTEIARVTAPTGRIALTVARPADGDPIPVQRLAEAAGLRGVAVRTDPAPTSGSEPVEFVTAFPPRPAGSGEDDVTAQTAEFHPPKPASEPEPGQPSRSRRRRLLLAGSVAALVVAAAVGVAWGLASDDPDQGAQASQSGLADDAAGDLEQPGPQDADEPLAGGGTPTDSPGDESDSGSGSASESSSSSGTESGSGGGQPSNNPPVIDLPGLTSGGLVLFVAPEASDPDGDAVTLLFEVEGMTIDPAQTCSTLGCKGEEQPGDFPHAAAIPLDFADTGYRSDVAVTITATDSHGATSRQTYAHTVSARTRVNFRELTLAFNDPAACFSDQDTRVLTFSLDLTGAIDATSGSGGITISGSSSGIKLAGGQGGTYDGEEPPPVGVLLSVTLSDIGSTGFAAPRQHTGDTEEIVTAFRNSPCAGTLTYVITHETT
jgi:SAM-dependent methyltransferase